MIKTNNRTMRVGAVFMALMLFFALTASVSATPRNTTVDYYDVTLYKKSAPNTESMANAIINGQATVTTTYDAGGNVENVNVKIPIKPIYKYKAMLGLITADGYLKEFKIDGINYDVVPPTVPYTTAQMIFDVDSIPANQRFTVTKSDIRLFKVGTSDPHWFSHVSPGFIIALE